MEFKLWLHENDAGYTGEHEAPDRGSGAPMHNLAAFYPNIYTMPLPQAVREYGQGHTNAVEAISIMLAAKDRPNKPITVYRAVPDINAEVQKKLNRISELFTYMNKFPFPPMGDTEARDVWTQSGFDKDKVFTHFANEYQKLQAQKKPPLKINPRDWVTTVKQYAIEHGQDHLLNNYKIVSKTVKAGDLYTSADHPMEWGYDPA